MKDFWIISDACSLRPGSSGQGLIEGMVAFFSGTPNKYGKPKGFMEAVNNAMSNRVADTMEQSFPQSL